MIGVDDSAESRIPLGSRIHVIGNSCSGKSALARRLSQSLGLPLVELDALNFLPGWVGLNATARAVDEFATLAARPNAS